jgi:hypothetical protein
MTRTTHDDVQTESRRLAKVTRSVLATEAEPVTSLADLADAVKYRCAQLGLPCAPEALSGAFALIASNTPLVREGTRREVRCAHRVTNGYICLKCGWHPADGAAVTRAEAAAILARLGVQL